MRWTLPLHPYTARPPAWSRRLHIEPLTDRTIYELELPDLLRPSPENPRPTIWLGVSSADAQSYVPDQLESGGRPGNESGIVPVLCQARWFGRPELEAPIPMEPVVPLFTSYPQGLPLAATLDLPDLLRHTDLRAGEPVLVERASAASVVAAYRVDAGGRVLAVLLGPDSLSTQTIQLPHPDDQRAVALALGQNSVDAVDHHHLVFLAQNHPSADQLFQPVGEKPIPFGDFRDQLSPRPARWIYRVRRADAAGRLSRGSAVIGRPVRVPSPAPPGAPLFDPDLSEQHFDLLVPPDDSIAAVLTFFAPTNPFGDSPGGELLRVPAAPEDYLAGRGIRLRSAQRLIQPRVIDLRQGSTPNNDDGLRRIAVDTTNLAAGPVRAWAVCLSVDGVPSRLGGPWTLGRNT